MDSSCDCELCQKACKRKPGWFLPSQVKDIEQFFNKSLKELLGHELAIDWFEDFEDLGISSNQIAQFYSSDVGKTISKFQEELVDNPSKFNPLREESLRLLNKWKKLNNI